MRWKATESRGIRILLGYNLPFLLWTMGAVLLAVTGSAPHFPCPLQSLLHFCPACGLTREYAAFMKGSTASPYFLVVFGLFILNTAWSLVKISGMSRQARTGLS